MSPSFYQAIQKSQNIGSNDNVKTKEKVIDTNTSDKTWTITYWAENKDDQKDGNDNKMGRGLEARVFQLDPDSEEGYKPLELVKSEMEADNGPKRNDHEKSSLTAYNAVAKLKKSKYLPQRFGQPPAPRSATFLVAIRLFEGHKQDKRSWPTLPTSEDFYDHIGVDPLHKNATGAMWEGFFLDRRTYGLGSEPVIDLAELNMIGRSLEKILQVDIIPATFSDDDEPNDPDRKTYSALVSNLFVKGNVDLKALFWKIRFLIKIHKFLSYIHKSSKSNEFSKKGKEKKTETREEFQMRRIRTSIEDVVRYLAKVMLEEVSPKPKTRMMPDNHVPGESNNYYVMMTIWYVWKYFKEGDKSWDFDWKDQHTKRKEVAHLPTLLDSHRLPSENWTFATADRDKVQLLRWYHYGSLLKLCEKQVLHSSWLEPGLKQKVDRLETTAKIASSAKLSSRVPYVAEDEIFDRLSFLSDELDLEPLQRNNIGIIASLSMKRVKKRSYTRTLNPGWVPRGVEESTSGPWEIHALCHHSRLVVLTKEEDSEQDWRAREHTHTEAEGFRKRICTFLNAEGTLIPCWERAHAKYRRGWLRSEATSVVATTLIIILEKIMKLAPNVENVVAQDPAGEGTSPQSLTGSSGLPSPEQHFEMLSKFSQDHDRHAREDQKKLLQEILHMEGVMKDQLDAFERFTNESRIQPPIVWELFRPPLTYHPINFFASLEDTPDLYKHTVLSKLSVPLSLNDEVLDCPRKLGKKRKDFGKKDIVDIFSNKKTQNLLFLFDIKATGKDEDKLGFTWEVEGHRYDSKQSAENLIEDSQLTWSLYDNLVDQEVQHRLLTVVPLREKDKPVHIPREILNLLVYVFHPESAPCLGDHIRDILNFSRFSCQKGDTWVASITLRSWLVQDNETIDREKPRDPNSQNSFDEFYLPTNLRQVWERVGEKVQGVNEKTIFKPEVSSIILSTNSFGDFSKCTVVSEFMKYERMEIIAEDARKLWQKFIHQPQTARCLVFFLLLGKMCEVITRHYEEAIKRLSSLLTLDGTFTNKEDEYPPEYELGVWSLDALYKLQNSLNATVASLLKAKEELTAQVITGPGKRSVRLERMCQEYMGKFDDNLMQLTAVNVQLNRRIELNTRNKDATSAILTMRDSRTAISQNGTVQRLTYLTIGYLPIALMAAIFAIPTDLNVLYFPSMANRGRSWFVGAIFIVSIFTYVLAVYIGNVLEFLRNFLRIPMWQSAEGKKRRQIKKTLSEDHPNLWKGIGSAFKWMFDNWILSNWTKHRKQTDQGLKPVGDDVAAAERGQAKFGSGSSSEHHDPNAQQPEVTQP